MADEIVIIGAGASGLMAARKLSAEGIPVRIIEGQHRAGGRINSITSHEFSMHIEAGAEFVHGKMPVTFEVLEQAGLSYHTIEGELWNARNEKPKKQEELIEDHRMLIQKLKDLKHDMSIRAFLDEHLYAEKYADLRLSILGYVEGYQLADPELASTYSLKKEWLNNEEEDQYRIDKGYGSVIDFLQQQCEQNGCTFHFNTTIKKIEWSKRSVKLFADDNKIFDATAAVISVPLGILQSNGTCKAFIEFKPSMPLRYQAIQTLGFGQTIKFILEFIEPFWENKNIVGENKMKQVGFIFSDAVIPTWWTQAPRNIPILTGWFGGPRVRKWKGLNDESLMQLATDSLATIFKIDHAVLVEKIVASRVFNWAADEYALGGYSYNSVNREKFRVILATPESNTLYFCGEALEKDPAKLGTVEAALASGLETAEQLIKSLRR